MHLSLLPLEIKSVKLKVQKFYNISKNREDREEILAGKSCNGALGEAEGTQS